MPIFSCILVLLIISYLLFEYLILTKALKRIPVRILVNGTRGKTITVRILHRMFMANNHITCAKTTGDEPVLWLPDGRHQMVRRWAPANIIENVRILRKWAAMNADVAVLECMALRAETQYALAWKIFRPTHTLITNIAGDHFETMGADPAEIADTMMLSSTGENIVWIPASNATASFKAGQVNTYIPVQAPVAVEQVPPAILNGHWGLIEKCIEHFNLDHTTGVRIFLEEWQNSSGRMHHRDINKRYSFWNLFSVNDTGSAALFLAHILQKFPDEGSRVVIFNARRDRPLRSKSFSAIFRMLPAGTRVWITGSGKHLARRFFEKAVPGMEMQLHSCRKAAAKVAAGFAEQTCIIGLGNMKGMEPMLREIQGV